MPPLHPDNICKKCGGPQTTMGYHKCKIPVICKCGGENAYEKVSKQMEELGKVLGNVMYAPPEMIHKGNCMCGKCQENLGKVVDEVLEEECDCFRCEESYKLRHSSPKIGLGDGVAHKTFCDPGCQPEIGCKEKKEEYLEQVDGKRIPIVNQEESWIEEWRKHERNNERVVFDNQFDFISSLLAKEKHKELEIGLKIGFEDGKRERESLEERIERIVITSKFKGIDHDNKIRAALLHESEKEVEKIHTDTDCCQRDMILKLIQEKRGL